MRYFYADSNKQAIGPYNLDELRQLHLNGTVRADTWVVEEGGSAWQPYTNLITTGANIGVAVPPTASIPTPSVSVNNNAVTPSTAILWFICCTPIGFMQWGQTAKGWVWVAAAICTGGLAGIPALVDYWMNFSIQQKRKVGEWEFFPRS